MMSDKNKTRIINFIKIVVFFLFIISTILTAFFPFANQDVRIVLDMESFDKMAEISAHEIRNMSDFSIEIKDISMEHIREVRLYRKFNTVCIDKFTIDILHMYANLEKDKIVFNEEACEVIKNISESFLMERLIFIEAQFALWLLIEIGLGALGEKIDTSRRDNHGPIYEINRFINDLKKYRRYIVYAAKADLKAEVANSYLNRLWWLLEPFFNMLVYVIVFGKIMGSSVENYATFIFSGLLMWNFFSKTINYSVKCIRSNRDIVTKVYVPKHVLLISNMVLNFMKLLFSLIVLIPMLLIFNIHIGVNVFWVIPAYIVMMLISFGVGMIFIHYGVYIDDLAYAVGILLQMMMFLSGVFYDVVTSLTAPLNAMMLVINPVAMFVDTMRNALLNNIVSNVPLIILWIIISGLISYMGIHIVYKNENAYVKVV